MQQGTFFWLSKEPSISAFRDGLSYILSKPISSLIILSCSDNHYPEQDVDNLLASINLPVCGGCYPHVFLENTLLATGVVFIGLPFDINVQVFADIDNNADNIDRLLEQNSSIIHATNALMFYDGLMANTEVFIEELHSLLENHLVIAGGGAGNLDFIARPCVYTNDGIKAGVIQLVILPQKLTTGIGHGWQILEGPFLVSESTGATIESLNYQEAFDVYQETVEKLSDFKFSEHDFFDISKHFPFGIESIHGELLVRDPIVVTEQAILCVGNVPINSMVYILKGEQAVLIDSAAKATDVAQQNQGDITIVFDCISRKLYLEDAFEQELALFCSHNDTQHSFGVLSLGEIANDGGGSIKLLNKSTVIGCL
ncbi:MAG: FIST signal transduction protein [Thalassotalea sp.]